MERPIARRQAFRWASFSAIPRAEVGRLLAPLDEPGRGSNGPAHRSCLFSDIPNARSLAGENFRAADVVDARAALGVPFGFEANRSVGLRTPLSGRSSRTGQARTWSGGVPVDSARRNGLLTWVSFRGDATFRARPLTWPAFPPRSGFVQRRVRGEAQREPARFRLSPNVRYQ